MITLASKRDRGVQRPPSPTKDLPRDGDTWAEEQIDLLPAGSYDGLRREQVLRRLVQYLKQGAPARARLDREATQQLESGM